MHQGAFLGANWTVRRKLSVPANPRRTYQPHGAQWNVQVVRGKVTTRCLWNACKALSLGLVLLLVGCAMATIGYYADQLSVAQEVRGNSTVRVKNESRGFHLNNLSYAGPIVMGVGGFIVVAACVMTFEARDSAAKVVPARFKFNHTIKTSPLPNKTSGSQERADSGRRSASCQTRWDNQLGLFRPPDTSPSGSDVLGRRALTAAFVQFSRALHHKQVSVESSSSHKRLGSQPIVTGLRKSPSAPNLQFDMDASIQHTPQPKPKSPKLRTPKPSSNSLLPVGRGCTMLSPYLLQRQALSMDNPSCSRESLELGASAGSQGSMAMDLHVPNDCPVTLRVRDQSRRSETARRHLFVRQRPVEDEEGRDAHLCSPRLVGHDLPAIRSRANTGDSCHHCRDTYSRSNTEESRGSHPRSRANTGESIRYHRRGSTKFHHTRSNTDEARHRRESVTSDHNRRPRESNSKPFFSRSSGDECRHPHCRSPHSPYSISRSNTDDSTHRQDFELAYIRTSTEESCSQDGAGTECVRRHSPIVVSTVDIIQELEPTKMERVDDSDSTHI